jgi:hypothetical protein
MYGVGVPMAGRPGKHGLPSIYADRDIRHGEPNTNVCGSRLSPAGGSAE